MAPFSGMHTGQETVKGGPLERRHTQEREGKHKSHGEGSRTEAAFKEKKSQRITLKKIGIKIQRKMGHLEEVEGERTVCLTLKCDTAKF